MNCRYCDYAGPIAFHCRVCDQHTLIQEDECKGCGLSRSEAMSRPRYRVVEEADGLTQSEIARLLCVYQGTVRWHLRRLGMETGPGVLYDADDIAMIRSRTRAA